METLLYARDNRQKNFNIRLNWCIEIRKSSPEIGSITFLSFVTLFHGPTVSHSTWKHRTKIQKCFQKKIFRIHIISHQRVYFVMIVGTTLIMTRRWWDDALLKSRSSHVFTLRFSSFSLGLCRCCCSSHYQNWKWSLAHSKIVVGWLARNSEESEEEENIVIKKSISTRSQLTVEKHYSRQQRRGAFFPLWVCRLHQANSSRDETW